MLKAIMRGSELIEPLPALERIRSYAQEQLSRLPDGLRVLKNARVYPVHFSPVLRVLTERMDIDAELH